MTDNERLFARAIAPSMVTYLPGIGTKRFARDMAWNAEHQPQRELSPKQALYLRQIVVRYRRQIAADVVRLARDELRELEAASA